MAERMLVDTIAGVRLRRLVWLDMPSESEDEDMSGVPCHGETHATITVRPPVALVPKLLADVLNNFTKEVSLEHDIPASDIVAIEAATVLRASIENDAPEVIRQAYLSVLATEFCLRQTAVRASLPKTNYPFSHRPCPSFTSSQIHLKVV